MHPAASWAPGYGVPPPTGGPHALICLSTLPCSVVELTLQDGGQWLPTRRSSRMLFGVLSVRTSGETPDERRPSQDGRSLPPTPRTPRLAQRQAAHTTDSEDSGLTTPKGSQPQEQSPRSSHETTTTGEILARRI